MKKYLGVNKLSPLSYTFFIYKEWSENICSYTVQVGKPVKRPTYHKKKSFDAKEDLKNIFIAANKASNDQNQMLEAKSWRRKSVELRSEI